MRTTRHLAAVSILVLLAASPSSAETMPAAAASPAAQWQSPEPLFQGLGSLHHPVTTKSPEAQRYFDQGMAFIYAFNHDEAAGSFRQAVKLDPTMAMGWWGIALALGPNINLPEDTERGKSAYDAIQHARALEPQSSGEERALIEALAKRYTADGKMTTAQEQAYSDAMRGVWKQYHGDPDVGALFAESLMDLHPWQLWSNDGKPAPGTAEAVATLETVLAAHPEHMGANHYYIHAVEASPNPERAMPSAKRLATAAPAAGHLVHMPAHIYIRTGRYEDSANANLRAIEADRKYIKQRPAMGVYRMMYYPHNIQFLWESYMMEGNRAGATRASRELSEAVPAEMIVAMPNGEFLVPTMYFTEARFGDWDAILAEPAPSKNLGYTTGVWHYARGLAFAAKGRRQDAAAEQRALGAIIAVTPDDRLVGMNSAKSLLQIGSETLAGRCAAKAGNRAEAIAHLERAVAIQDGLNYEEPAPWYYPVRQTLGYELMADGKYQEAEDVFRADLKRNPENGWSLAGLARCLRARKAGGELADVEARFNRAWTHADVQPDIGEIASSK